MAATPPAFYLDQGGVFASQAVLETRLEGTAPHEYGRSVVEAFEAPRRTGLRVNQIPKAPLTCSINLSGVNGLGT